MIRKFNYTGRKKINTSNINITLFSNGSLKQFDADLNFDNMDLPGNASVYIEPYYHFSFMRFSFGTVEKISPPNDTVIREIPFSDIIYFRIKVVDESNNNGLLLAYADKIKPVSSEIKQDNRRSLLPVNFSAPLNHKPFKLNFTDDSPILDINKNIDNPKDVLKSKEFTSLVFPSLVKEIATTLANDYIEYIEYDDHWASDWYNFFTKILQADTLPSEGLPDDEITEWTDNVVDKFCRQNKIMNVLNSSSLVK